MIKIVWYFFKGFTTLEVAALLFYESFFIERHGSAVMQLPRIRKIVKSSPTAAWPAMSFLEVFS